MYTTQGSKTRSRTIPEKFGLNGSIYMYEGCVGPQRAIVEKPRGEVPYWLVPAPKEYGFWIHIFYS
jgi:hypothetical protein